MTDRLKKEDFVRLLATRMNADEATATPMKCLGRLTALSGKAAC